ncbi:MAG TPA: ATP-binding cassette domain-containing protein, partial [Actinomycetes bacterium]
ALAGCRVGKPGHLRHVGLSEERYRVMGGYSTGMKQRVKLAQALVHDPQLVLLDEPTNGLDPAARDDMLELVRKIGTEFGIAVLVTSHLLGELERISDHVVVLDGGRLLRSSATSEFTHATGLLLIEVSGPGDAQDRMHSALAAAGLQARLRGQLIEVDSGDDRVHDVIRDVAADLELGLVRLQQGHHHIEDVFREGGAGHVQPV